MLWSTGIAIGIEIQIEDPAKPDLVAISYQRLSSDASSSLPQEDRGHQEEDQHQVQAEVRKLGSSDSPTCTQGDLMRLPCMVEDVQAGLLGQSHPRDPEVLRVAVQGPHRFLLLDDVHAFARDTEAVAALGVSLARTGIHQLAGRPAGLGQAKGFSLVTTRHEEAVLEE